MSGVMKPSLRTSRLAALGAGGVVSVALLTGCGDDGASGTGSEDRSASQGQPQSSPAQVVQATNKKTTQAKTARIKLATTVAAGGNSETITGSGVLDLQDGTSRMRLGQGGRQLEQRIVNGVLYQKPPAASGQLPEGKSWMKVDLQRLNRSQGTGGPAMSDPANSFAYTKSLSEKDVRKVGEETVNGVSTTHYRVDLYLSKLAEGDSAQERKAARAVGRRCARRSLDRRGRTHPPSADPDDRQGHRTDRRGRYLRTAGPGEGRHGLQRVRHRRRRRRASVRRHRRRDRQGVPAERNELADELTRSSGRHTAHA